MWWVWLIVGIIVGMCLEDFLNPINMDGKDI